MMGALTSVPTALFWPLILRLVPPLKDACAPILHEYLAMRAALKNPMTVARSPA